MSDNINELRNMLVNFRVSELQMLLGFAGKNKTGRKTELQQRALDLLRVRSHPIHQKIRDLYRSIQQSSAATTSGFDTATPPTLSPNATLPSVNHTITDNLPVNMSQTQGSGQRGHMVWPSRQQQMFGQQQLYNSYQPYPSVPATNNNNNINNQNKSPIAQFNFPTTPDIKMRRLPFFDIIAELLKPSTLIPTNGQRLQETQFVFHLNTEHATEISMTRDVRQGIKCEYSKQIQLRFCHLEAACELEDNFPPAVNVKVNNKSCPLPAPIPTNKQGVEPKRPPRPVNITPMVKLSPTVTNTIHITWAQDYGRAYAICLNLVHKLSSQDLQQRLKRKGSKHADHTRALIRDNFLKDQRDQEITTTSYKVSLLCPLGKMRMTTPCRPITCTHLQCFDSMLFLQMNERKPTWICPVCDKPATYDNLAIDGYFQEVIASKSLPASVTEIELYTDGSWSQPLEDPLSKNLNNAHHMPVKALAGASVSSASLNDDLIEIICDDSDMNSSDINVTEKTAIKSAAPAAASSSTDAANQNFSAHVLIPNKDASSSNKRSTPIDATSASSKQVDAPTNSDDIENDEHRRVVDLTVSDSEDDEQPPLAKRTKSNNHNGNSANSYPPQPDSTVRYTDSNSISPNDAQSRISTPGPSSVSSSGRPPGPAIITLDDSLSPTPALSPHSSPQVPSVAIASNATSANSMLTNINHTATSKNSSSAIACDPLAIPSPLSSDENHILMQSMADPTGYGHHSSNILSPTMFGSIGLPPSTAMNATNQVSNSMDLSAASASGASSALYNAFLAIDNEASGLNINYSPGY